MPNCQIDAEYDGVFDSTRHKNVRFFGDTLLVGVFLKMRGKYDHKKYVEVLPEEQHDNMFLFFRNNL